MGETYRFSSIRNLNSRKIEREYVEQKIKEFLKAGGTITRVKMGMGVSSQLEQEIGYRTYSR